MLCRIWKRYYANVERHARFYVIMTLCFVDDILRRSRRNGAWFCGSEQRTSRAVTVLLNGINGQLRLLPLESNAQSQRPCIYTMCRPATATAPVMPSSVGFIAVRDCVGSAGRQLPVGDSDGQGQRRSQGTDGRGNGREGSDGSEPAAPRGPGEFAPGDAVGQVPWHAMHGRV